MALLSVGVGGYGLFLVFTGFQYVPPPIMNSHFFTPLGIQIHIAASSLALAVGAFQFWRPLRMRRPMLHRWNGRVYVAACVLGGLAGGAIALYSSAGLVANWGFFVLAVLWVPFTLLALAAAMRRDFVAHRRWMIRSFALTFGAVTLRLYLPVGVMTVGFDTAYPIIAWLAWVPNLIAVEIWLRAKPAGTAPGAARAVA
ncbi:MAG: DUF2306 domain-containing protein [Pseudomonadales bacterium]